VAVEEPEVTRDGQSLAEYALIVALVVLISLITLIFFGTQIGDVLSLIAERIHDQ